MVLPHCCKFSQCTFLCVTRCLKQQGLDAAFAEEVASVLDKVLQTQPGKDVSRAVPTISTS